LLEDQGYVRAVEAEGKRVYHITPEGEAFLDQHRDTVDDILGRVRDTLREVLGGTMGDLNEAFARLAALVYREAWRRGPRDPLTAKMVQILERAMEEIRGLREQPGG
jgi:DNA-binding PadR family transcriptional regulator